MNIRIRLLLYFGLMAALAVLAFVVLWLYGVPKLGVEGIYSHEYRRSIQAVEALADKERDTFERWFESHRRDLRLLSANEGLSAIVSSLGTGRGGVPRGARESLQRQLVTAKEASPGVYHYLYIVESLGGRLLAASEPDWTQVPREHLALLQEAAEPGLGQFVYLNRETSGPGMLLTSQIAVLDRDGNASGQLAGILVAHLALDVPLKSDDVTMRQTLGSTGAALLMDHEGQLLIQHSVTPSVSRDHAPILAQAVAGTEGVKLLQVPGGEETIAVFRHLHLGASDGLSLALVRGTDDAVAAIQDSFLRLAGLGVMIFLIFMGMAVFAVNRIAAAEAEILALNSSLEARVEERTQELEDANQYLTETLAHLERTRDDLVRSEKLAALGSLVAGVAHELNTPIGNSLTVASTLQDHASAFATEMTRGITRSRLENYVASTRDGAALLTRSLHQAAELVASFKQVAVDQTSVNRRKFLLGETINEILLTLGPSLRKTTHAVECAIPADIVMESYPGPLGQIITNLVNNALLHGFEGRENGKIMISAQLTGENQVQLRIADNGVGIPEAHIKRVFDPFFTTKLGQGGSGLGLNIVYNLVNGILNGRIQVDSVPGLGASFTLILPLKAPINEPAPV